MENTLYQIAKELQMVMEEKLNGQAVGTCYLSGHCLSIIFNRLGFRSRKVTGKLAILLKNGKSKYATYGRFKLKGKQIGIYHTWCEVEVNGETFIVDPSLKANLKYSRKNLGVKIHSMVEKDTLVTKAFSTYYYKYLEDDSLEVHSNQSLETLTTEILINYIIEQTLERIGLLFIDRTA